MKVYLDNAATTPLSDEVKSHIIKTLDVYGNPSSTHYEGEKAKSLLKKSRETVAKFIHADSDCIYFTSGGSASNTLSIRGFYEKNECPMLYSPISHKSILKLMDSYGDSTSLCVDGVGNISLRDLENKLSTRPSPCLVIVDYANSEIGTVQNVRDIISLVHYYDGIVYLDCTGSISQIELDVKDLDVDMAGFSAHKLGGLKGCGILYRKKHIQLAPLICGEQEAGLFAGTENVLGIASLAKAIEHYDYSAISSKNRDYVRDWLLENVPKCYVVGAEENRLYHNLFVCFRGTDAESLLLALDLFGIAVSAGSACNSQSIEISSTLKAIHMDESDAKCCIRMSFSGNETLEELDYVCSCVRECIDLLKNTEQGDLTWT